MIKIWNKLKYSKGLYLWVLWPFSDLHNIYTINQKNQAEHRTEFTFIISNSKTEIWTLHFQTTLTYEHFGCTNVNINIDMYMWNYFTILHYTPRNILHFTILLYTILHYTILHYIIYFRSILLPVFCLLYYTVLHFTILYYTTLYYTMLFYTMLCYALLYCTIQYYTMLY